MTELPTGTVTFLFTDIEGSTKLLQGHGERYAELLEQHRRVLRDAFESHEGVEVDTQGDAFFVVFSSAAAAVAAAAEAQPELELPVRMGIHTGEPQLVDGGYVGIDVHRAARICSAAHGRQVLLSETAQRLLDEATNRLLLDLGRHRLKDVGELRLYQLGDGEFPPLRTLHQADLPTPSTPLIGRKKELADVLKLFRSDGARLVTVLGPGGIGKTRFALAVAGELSQDVRDGTFFVDLSPLREPDLVNPAIAAVLRATGDVAEQIAERELLLVLDNFEHVLPAAASLAPLVERCPNLRLLATSREPLDLRSERKYPLEPLPEAPAVELFRQRAEAVRPGVELDYSAVNEICRRLDLLPLAIELAAARVKSLPLEALRDRLERRLPLLSARSRDAPERQRTLRAAIEWSHDLLTAEEQTLFARLAVFSGGWTLEAAEEVCETDLDVLDSLVSKSLVRFDGDRYGMLETIREYASEQLEGSRDAEPLCRDHLRYYLALAEEAEPELWGRVQEIWIGRLGSDYDNVRAALTFALERGNEDSAARIAGALVIFWFLRSLHEEGLAFLERVVASSPSGAAGRKVRFGLGFLRVLTGRLGEARAPLEEALADAREASDLETAARTLNALGLLVFFADEPRRACELFSEAAELAQQAGDAWCHADAVGTLGSILPLVGAIEAGEAYGLEAVEFASRHADEQGKRMGLFAVALARVRRGDADGARIAAEEGVDASRALGDAWFVSYFLWLLSLASLAAGRLERARSEAEESLDVARTVGAGLLITCACEALAQISLEQGDLETAAAALDEADAAAADRGAPKSYRSAALLARARLDIACGDSARARRVAAQARALAEEVGDTWAADRADAVAASIATPPADDHAGAAP